MLELFKTIASWLTTSGIKVIGILITLILLSQISRWIVKWLERFIPEKDPLPSPGPLLGRQREEELKVKS